jgi:hypothetical protein
MYCTVLGCDNFLTFLVYSAMQVVQEMLIALDFNNLLYLCGNAVIDEKNKKSFDRKCFILKCCTMREMNILFSSLNNYFNNHMFFHGG